jgi:undecaprenyl-diphosphatase
MTRASVRRELAAASVLGAAFVAVTVLAAGPLERLDATLRGRWVMEKTPALEPLLQQVLDRLASQAVCVPVLAAVAITIAVRRRSWRPVLVAGSAELAWLLIVGALKVLFARPAPVVGNPSFYEGGLWRLGEMGVSYPSGHAAEVFLIYGTAVHLIHRYTATSQNRVQLLRILVGALAINTVVVSFWLGWHWLTDLVGGLLVGAFLLAILMAVDRKVKRLRP